MGLFKKLKKAFKKVTGFVKKVVKKTVKAVKKIGKKIGSSKILKALAIAAAVVVTGGAALGAMGATASAGGFTGWMVGASNAITGATVAGLNVGAVMKPFAAVGSAIGTGVSAVTGINLAPASTATSAQLSAAVSTNPAAAAQASTAASRGALNLPTNIPGAASVSSTGIPTVGAAGGIPTTLPNATVGSFATQKGVVGAVGGTASSQLATTVPAALGTSNIGTTVAAGTSTATAPAQASWFARHPKLTAAAGYVGTTVGTNVLTGAAMQYIQGDPQQQGSMAGAAYEGGDYLDPLKVYAAQQGINTDGIYQHMMYGNQDPSTQYGAELFRQQTFGVA